MILDFSLDLTFSKCLAMNRFCFFPLSQQPIWSSYLQSHEAEYTEESPQTVAFIEIAQKYCE